MNSPRKPLVVVIAALCAGLAFDASAAPRKKEKTIGDLTARPVVVQPLVSNPRNNFFDELFPAFRCTRAKRIDRTQFKIFTL